MTRVNWWVEHTNSRIVRHVQNCEMPLKCDLCDDAHATLKERGTSCEEVKFAERRTHIEHATDKAWEINRT